MSILLKVVITTMFIYNINRFKKYLRIDYVKRIKKRVIYVQKIDNF